MVILVRVAKIPAAGVKPPYIQDWKPAARDPMVQAKIRYMLSG
jgi:hypothetical protein